MIDPGTSNWKRFRNSRTVSLRLGVTLLLSVSIAVAQTIPEQAYSGLRWRQVGPFRAGRAIAAAGIPGDPTTFYFGAVDGGMWKTTNAGLTWEPISDGQMNPSIGAFAIAPSDPRIIYVGTGEADIRSDMTYGDGVYKSTDGGLHWKHIGLRESRHIGRVLIDAHNPDVVLVAALGHAYGPNEQRGVFRTTDGGQTWLKVLYQNPDVGAVDLACDPLDPAVVYASMWQARRTPWSQYPPNQGPGSGLFKSTDEGATWSEIAGHGLPAKPYGRIGLAVAVGSRGNAVYASVDLLKGQPGLYRSSDGGVTWQLISIEANITSRLWYFSGVTVDPQQPATVYIPNRSLMRSTDGGKTFTAIKGSPGGDDYHFLWIDPQDSRRMILASDQGTVLSLDGGATWSSWYNQPTGQFYHVATDNQFPYRIYGAQQDMGTTSITSRSDFGVITFRDWYSVGAGESGYIAPDPMDPNVVYGGEAYGGILRFDHRTGQSQLISPSLLSTFMTPAPLRKYRFTWTSPIVFDRRDLRTLYFGAQYLLRTRDGGLHWDPISPDLTRADNAKQSLSGPPTIDDAAAGGWGVIYSIAPSPLHNGFIWIGTDDGNIQLTTDGGRHWQNVTPKGLQPWSKISMIEASPFDPGEAYAAVDRHRLDDFAPCVYVTKDFGKHWTRADRGIGPLSYVQVVRSDLKRKGLLYAGTETGVYVSFDDGDNWQSLQLNLPMVSVRDLSVHDTDLVAGTHGRAFWVLDDLTPLQQMSRNVSESDVHLFRPRSAVRIRRSENKDTPLPPEFPHGTNPPNGAIINYSLGNTPRSPITLEILDAAGNLVRRYSSADRPEPPRRPPYFMEEWLPKFRPLSAQVGHNRFVWDLRYTPPRSRQHDYTIAAIAGRGTEREPQGPLVLPGTYEIRLTVDGQTTSQPLTVVMDPRVHVTDAVLREQLALAVNVWNTMEDEYALGLAVDTVHQEISALEQRTDQDAATRALLHSLSEKTASMHDSLNDGGLAQLATVIMGADREPTQQMREAYSVLKGKLSNARKQFEELARRDLLQANKHLKESGVVELKLIQQPTQHLKVRDLKQ